MIASTAFRPTLLMPSTCHHLLSGDDRIRFHVLTYATAEEAWSAADSHPIDVFVSQQSNYGNAGVSVILGILALQPSAAHVHIFDSIEHVATLANKSALIRLIPAQDVQLQLLTFCVELAQIVVSRQAISNDIERLREENEQYEFMLRHSLLS
jgi:hypothetical protein